VITAHQAIRPPLRNAFVRLAGGGLNIARDAYHPDAMAAIEMARIV